MQLSILALQQLVPVCSLTAQNRGTAVCANVPEIVLAGERALRRLEVEGVDFLGTNVVHEQRIALRRQAEPRVPGRHHSPVILQASDLLYLVVRNAHTRNRLVRTET